MPSSLPRGPTGRAPNDVAVIGIKPIDAALLPKAGSVVGSLVPLTTASPQNSPACAT
jgi:hypothetical protein